MSAVTQKGGLNVIFVEFLLYSNSSVIILAESIGINIVALRR